VVDLLGRTRALLLQMLEEPLATVEIARRLKVTSSAVNQHLRVLQSVGLLTSTRDRRQVLYRRTPLGDQLVGVRGARERTKSQLQGSHDEVEAHEAAHGGDPARGCPVGQRGSDIRCGRRNGRLEDKETSMKYMILTFASQQDLSVPRTHPTRSCNESVLVDQAAEDLTST
jgi:DNA-binding transcriptional ArsR family regulator